MVYKSLEHVEVSKRIINSLNEYFIRYIIFLYRVATKKLKEKKKNKIIKIKKTCVCKSYFF